MSTPIQKVASQIGQLWKDIDEAHEVQANNKDVAESATLNSFITDASLRAHRLEDSLALIRPNDMKDVLILLVSLTDTIGQVSESSQLNPEQLSLAARTLTAVIAFLEVELGTSAPSLGVGSLMTARSTWDQTIQEVRAIFTQYQRMPKAA
jgi:outer membrane murein-binding lipoprotein Lpp